MENILEKILSPQANRVYSLLSKGGEFTAKEIGRKLKVFPNAVYREIEKLKSLGLVYEIEKHPVGFKSKDPIESLGLLTDLIKQSFTGIQSESEKPLQISFIQNRKELLLLTNRDTKNSKTSLNIIVSGHEVPAETILAQKQAAERGVRVRILIQDLSASSKERIGAWQKMGIEVKHLSNVGGRIITIDEKIAYFTSYNQKNKQEAVGVRFEYAPLAFLMNELFEQRWQQAKEIKGV